MVTDDRAIRGLAPGGAIGGIGDACQAAVDHLAAGGRLRPSVWLERGGHLWRAADGARPPADRDGSWTPDAVLAATAEPARDLIVPGGWTADPVIRRAFESASELVVPDLAVACDGQAPPSDDLAAAQICIPLRCGGRVVGVLDVKLRRPVEGPDVDAVREAAGRLSARIDRLGGPPPESAAQRLLRHVAQLAALEDGDDIARAVLAAALDLTELDSAMLVHWSAEGHLEPCTAAGPLAERLAGIPPATLEALALRIAAPRAVTSVTAPGPRQDGGDQLAPVRAAGVRTLVPLALAAQDEPHGLLLVASERPVALSGEDGEVLELLAVHAAGCLRTAGLVRSLRERAASDPLTGLGHHATFHEALAASHRRPTTAILLCDLDDFKRLNDSFGHQHGDGVLRGVAAALSRAIRRGDRLFRIGGDEFAALVVVSDETEALDAGLRLRQEVEEAGLGVTLSIGIAVPRDGEPDAALLARADRALYRVKASGRDGVAVAGDDPAPDASTR
jgi:diguanylate cyclase (GGDEF)-like protein